MQSRVLSRVQASKSLNKRIPLCFNVLIIRFINGII